MARQLVVSASRNEKCQNSRRKLLTVRCLDAVALNRVKDALLQNNFLVVSQGDVLFLTISCKEILEC